MVSKFFTIVLISFFTFTLETTPASASALGVADILRFVYFRKDLGSNPSLATLPLCRRIFSCSHPVPRSRLLFCSYITARTEPSGVGQRCVSATRHAQWSVQHRNRTVMIRYWTIVSARKLHPQVFCATFTRPCPTSAPKRRATGTPRVRRALNSTS